MANGLLSNVKKIFTDWFKGKPDEKVVKQKSSIRIITKERKDFSTNLNLNLGSDTEAIDEQARLMEKTEPDLMATTQIRVAAIMALNVDFKGKGAGLGEPVEFAKTWWDGLPNKFNTFRSLLKGSITRGFGVLEKEWLYENKMKKWIISRLINHSIKHWEFDEDNQLLLRTQGQGSPVDESRYFSVLTFQEEDQNRYGFGMYEELYWIWYIKNNSLKFWSIFSERMIDPNLIAKYDKMDTDLQSRIETFFNDQMTGASVMIPSKDVIIEVLQKATLAGVKSYETFCRYLDAKFHIAMVGNTISMDSVGSGISFDKGTVTERIRFDILWSDVKWFETWFNESIVWPQIAINFPNVKPGDVKMDIMIGRSIDPDVFRNVVTDLHNAGVDLPKNHTLEQFGIPNIKEGEEIIPGKTAESRQPAGQNFSALDETEINYLKKLDGLIKN